LFERIQGFDERFTANEDFDLYLRLQKVSQIVALPSPMGTHHTIHYTQRVRLFDLLIRRGWYPGVLLRKNIVSVSAVRMLIKRSSGAYLGAAVIAMCAMGCLVNMWFLAAAGICVLADCFLGLRKDPSGLLGRTLVHYLLPWIILGGFFCFPSKPAISWRRVK
jgi:hypothetical protein